MAVPWFLAGQPPHPLTIPNHPAPSRPLQEPAEVQSVTSFSPHLSTQTHSGNMVAPYHLIWIDVVVLLFLCLDHLLVNLMSIMYKVYLHPPLHSACVFLHKVCSPPSVPQHPFLHKAWSPPSETCVSFLSPTGTSSVCN